MSILARVQSYRSFYATNLAILFLRKKANFKKKQKITANYWVYYDKPPLGPLASYRYSVLQRASGYCLQPLRYSYPRAGAITSRSASPAWSTITRSRRTPCMLYTEMGRCVIFGHCCLSPWQEAIQRYEKVSVLAYALSKLIKLRIVLLCDPKCWEGRKCGKKGHYLTRCQYCVLPIREIPR